MRNQKTKNSKAETLFIAGFALLALLFIGSEMKFQKYEQYAMSNNCEWQMINGQEICK